MNHSCFKYVKEFTVVNIKTKVIVDLYNMTEVEFPVEVCYYTVNDYGWIRGHITVQSVCRYHSCYYEFEAKVYGMPSKYGIDDGCISKLYVKDINTNTEVIGYDRGWYCEPCCPQEYAVVNALLDIFEE